MGERASRAPRAKHQSSRGPDTFIAPNAPAAGKCKSSCSLLAVPPRIASSLTVTMEGSLACGRGPGCGASRDTGCSKSPAGCNTCACASSMSPLDGRPGILHTHIPEYMCLQCCMGGQLSCTATQHTAAQQHMYCMMQPLHAPSIAHSLVAERQQTARMPLTCWSSNDSSSPVSTVNGLFRVAAAPARWIGCHVCTPRLASPQAPFRLAQHPCPPAHMCCQSPAPTAAAMPGALCGCAWQIGATALLSFSSTG